MGGTINSSPILLLFLGVELPLGLLVNLLMATQQTTYVFDCRSMFSIHVLFQPPPSIVLIPEADPKIRFNRQFSKTENPAKRGIKGKREEDGEGPDCGYKLIQI